MQCSNPSERGYDCSVSHRSFLAEGLPMVMRGPESPLRILRDRSICNPYEAHTGSWERCGIARLNTGGPQLILSYTGMPLGLSTSLCPCFPTSEVGDPQHAE